MKKIILLSFITITIASCKTKDQSEFIKQKLTESIPIEVGPGGSMPMYLYGKFALNCYEVFNYVEIIREKDNHYLGVAHFKNWTWIASLKDTAKCSPKDHTRGIDVTYNESDDGKFAWKFTNE